VGAHLGQDHPRVSALAETFRSRTYLEEELSDIQKKKVDMLVDKVLDLNVFEMQYFQAITKEKVMKTSNINPMKLNLDWPSLKPDGKPYAFIFAAETGSWPPANPNWFKQQEMLAQLGPMMGGAGFGLADGAQQAAPQAEAEKPKEEAKEAPKEKSHYDIELTKFDQAKKITLIKEVRALLNLGLKEAKEMVEGAPVWLKKEVKKEDAEKLVEKLKELGAECRLA